MSHAPKDGVKNNYFAAMTAVLFSTDPALHAELTWAEERLIDTFFDTMKFGDDDADPSVDFIAIANMMELIDMNNRYVYRGSLTTPPCATDVLWNVVSTVYPIK